TSPPTSNQRRWRPRPCPASSTSRTAGSLRPPGGTGGGVLEDVGRLVGVVVDLDCHLRAPVAEQGADDRDRQALRQRSGGEGVAADVSAHTREVRDLRSLVRVLLSGAKKCDLLPQ